LAPEPVWKGEEYLTPRGFDPRTVQPVASRYTDCAIPNIHKKNPSVTTHEFLLLEFGGFATCFDKTGPSSGKT
jgi:hypothetical protein